MSRARLTPEQRAYVARLWRLRRRCFYRINRVIDAAGMSKNTSTRRRLILRIAEDHE